MTNEQTAAQARRLVMAFFKDAEKTALWFETKNPMFGNLKPADLVSIGKADKVLRTVKLLLEENSVEDGLVQRLLMPMEISRVGHDLYRPDGRPLAHWYRGKWNTTNEIPDEIRAYLNKQPEHIDLHAFCAHMDKLGWFGLTPGRND